MLSDEYPAMAFLSPESRGGTTVHLHLYVKDVDATVARAVGVGGKLVRPVQDQFYGDRTGTLEDPFGHVWHIATHVEDLSKAELRRRADDMAKKAAGG
jgi:PhnB protein